MLVFRNPFFAGLLVSTKKPFNDSKQAYGNMVILYLPGTHICSNQ